MHVHVYVGVCDPCVGSGVCMCDPYVGVYGRCVGSGVWNVGRMGAVLDLGCIGMRLRPSHRRVCARVLSGGVLY